MIELLFSLLAISMVFVNEKERLTSAIFTLFTLLFYFISYPLSGGWYYLIAASYDALMMAIMFLFHSTGNHKLTKYLCVACSISILIQLLGYRICVMHGNGHIYDYMAIVFYVCIIILFLTRTRLNGKFAGDNGYSNRFLRDNFRRA